MLWVTFMVIVMVRVMVMVMVMVRVRVRVRLVSGLGYGFGTGLPAIVDVKLSLLTCSCSRIAVLTEIFVDKMDLSIQQRRDEMMTVLKEENERLKDELWAKQAEREKYVQEQETTYQQMRKELESQMNTCKGKVILVALRTENILLQADLELKMSDLEKSNDKVNCLTKGNEK
jgi:hypothetical protein